MYCIKCGADNETGASFCRACGSSMKEEAPAVEKSVSSDTLSAPAVLDYNNPEEPKPASPAPKLHYESKGREHEKTVYSHPRSYSPSHTPAPAYASAPAAASTLTPAPTYTPDSYAPVAAPVYYAAPGYVAPAYSYGTVAVPTYTYRTVAVPTVAPVTPPVYVVPTWKLW